MSARIIDAAIRTGAIVGLAIAAVVAFPEWLTRSGSMSTTRRR